MKSEIRNPKSELDLSGCAVVSAAEQEGATPEIDAFMESGPLQRPTLSELAEFAKRLVRERDAARRDVAEMNARLIEEVASYLRTMEELREENRRLQGERNDARNQLETIVAAFGLQEPVGEESCAEYVLRLLKKERDEARAALSGRTVSCSQCNEAAGKIASMREAIQESYKMLKVCEFNGGTHGMECQECFSHITKGHKPSCDHAAAIAKLQPFLSAGGAADE